MSLKQDKADNVQARFTVWLKTLVQRTRINYVHMLKRKYNCIGIDEITDNSVITIVDDEHYRYERDNFEFTDEKLEKAFLKLHSKKRRVLILFFCLGKTEAEISKELGCPIRYVYDLKYHALKRLRELLNE